MMEDAAPGAAAMAHQLLLLCCGIYLVVLLYYLLSRLNPLRRNLSSVLQLSVAALTIISLVLALVALRLTSAEILSWQRWLVAIVAIGIMGISLTWLYLLDLMANRNAEIIYLLARRNEEFTTLRMEYQRKESEERYSEAMQTSYDRLRSLRHDIKNQMIGLRGLLEQDDLGGARGYLDHLQAELMPSELLSLTKIPQVDAILSFKMHQAASLGIRTDLLFVAPEELPLDAVDCCSILGNILDNAIEGAQQVSPEDRYLLVEAEPKRNMWCIRVENASAGNYRRRGDIFLSTKDREWRGLGLRRTRELVEENDGYLLIDAAPNSFTIEIFLPWTRRTPRKDD